MAISTPETSRCVAPLPARRRFFERLTYFFGAVAGVLFAVPLVGYLLGLRKRQVIWMDIGPVGDFPAGQTRFVTFDNPIRKPWDGMVAHTGVYVRNDSTDATKHDQFLVLAVNCAHLGCPVTWFPNSGLFMCPCHGGVYYANGERASGPPPRGLFRGVWRVRGGNLEIQAPHYPTLQDTLEKPAAELAAGSPPAYGRRSRPPKGSA